MKTLLTHAVFCVAELGSRTFRLGAGVTDANRGDSGREEVRRLMSRKNQLFSTRIRKHWPRLWSDIGRNHPLKQVVSKQQFLGWSSPASW